MHVLSGLHLVDTHYVPYCERDCGKSLKHVFGCMVPALMLPLFSGNRFSWCQSEEKEEMWPRGNLEYVFLRLKWLYYWNQVSESVPSAVPQAQTRIESFAGWGGGVVKVSWRTGISDVCIWKTSCDSGCSLV